MAFQWIFDNAENISIDKKEQIGQSITRNQTVRAVSRGSSIWKFTVTFPNGPRWSDYRRFINEMETFNRFTSDTVQINNPGLDWLYGYQGDASDPGAITATYTSGNSITLTGGQATSGYNFRAGDLIQLGSSGAVYQVVDDVAYDSNTVTLHRPVKETAGSYTLIVGQDVTWNVICVSMPTWTIFARDQISWDGPFVFYEALV